MLDDSANELLAALLSLCEGGGFKIVEEGELLGRTSLKSEEVVRGMTLLETQRLIELRYAEDGAYCVRLLPAGRSYAARTRQEREERIRLQWRYFLFSALGAFLGGALVTIVALLVRYV